MKRDERIAVNNKQLANWDGQHCRLWAYSVSHSVGLLRLGGTIWQSPGLEIWCSGISKIYLENVQINDCRLSLRSTEDEALQILEDQAGKLSISCSFVNVGVSTIEDMISKRWFISLVGADDSDPEANS